MEYISAKKIITSFKSNDNFFPFDYKMNLYRGCNHGCIYCDSRSDCYQIKNFDKVLAKENSIKMLDEELKRKRKTGIIATGSMSDPYNYFELYEKQTYEALKLINKHGFGVWITTKSDLVIRDIKLLKDISRHSIVYISFSITTFDDNISKKIEPNVALSSQRFNAMKKLSDEGIYTGTWLNPMLPFITDNQENIKEIVKRTYESGGKYVFCYFGMTLRSGNREYYYRMLDRHFPQVEAMYIKTYGDSYVCTSKKVKQLYYVLKSECERYGLLYDIKLINKDIKQIKSYQQLSLF